MKRLIAAMVIVFAALAGATPASATLQDDVAAARQFVSHASAAVTAGDMATARQEYKAYEDRWFAIEDGVRDASRDSYRAIETQMRAVTADLSAVTLAALDRELERFATSRASASSPADGKATVQTLVKLLDQTRAAAAAGDGTTAGARFEDFTRTWSEVEGEIKTRSSSAYRQTEIDMGRVQTALGEGPAGAIPILDGMRPRLTPFVDAGTYRPYDAAVILLREGLEALLVVVALLAFVRKSGNEDKRAWVWGGAGAGVAASLAVGILIKVVFDKALNGGNRELMEGITGIAAAAMLLYVSYWLHRKASLGAWRKYIGDSTTRALARGSLIGLACLAFLAVFREGAETVLFLLGMAGRISTGDLLLGLGAGVAILAVVGVLLLVVGVKIPVRPFFAVASVLTFYLCFKFLGTGDHALQVSGHLPATTADYLPESELLGMYPTWQTVVPQALLLLAGLAVMGRERVVARRSKSDAQDQAVAVGASPPH